MLRFLLLLFLLSLCFGSSGAAIQYHDFIIKATTVTRLCKTHDVITVNGQFPGPTIKVRNGDTLVITVINYSQYNVTIHWHGIRQMRTGWADGPDLVTQCSIRTGGSYTYRYTIIDQEGTLWWHAHTGWLRASVYGALVILPKEGASYPFLGPVEETEPIVLGEWWNVDPMRVLRQALMTGAAPNISDAYTINSQPGDLYPCSSQDIYKLKLKRGKTYLLRIINAAMNQELFFKIAEHIMMVVAADASYTKPLHTDVIIIAPGQTTDVLIVANKPFKRYYMAARAYVSAQNVPFDNTTTTAIIEYDDDTPPPLLPTPSSPPYRPVMPAMPAYNDTATVTQFTTSLRGLGTPEWPTRVPTELDESLLFTVGLGMVTCPAEQEPSSCQGPAGNKFAASMNNLSFVLPQRLSLLQAHYLGVPGVFTLDFPAKPPLQFDYTAPNVSTELWYTSTSTRLYPLRYGSRVQVVLQGTGIFRAESHPMHLHGYDFYIVGLGSGNYDPLLSPLTFNLIDPPMRNTVAVPANGWAVIRFVADNPGVWILHCHLDVHLAWGLGMAFVVDNGPHLLAKLEAPPLDLPLC